MGKRPLFESPAWYLLILSLLWTLATAQAQVPLNSNDHPESHTPITSCAITDSAIEAPTGSVSILCPTNVPCAFNCTVDMVREPNYITLTVTTITTIVKPVTITTTLTTTEWSTVYAGNCTKYTTLWHDSKDITTTVTVSITKEVSSTTYVTEYEKVIATKTLLCKASDTGVPGTGGNPGGGTDTGSPGGEGTGTNPPGGGTPGGEPPVEPVEPLPPQGSGTQLVHIYNWNDQKDRPRVTQTLVDAKPTARPPGPEIHPECSSKGLRTYQISPQHLSSGRMGLAAEGFKFPQGYYYEARPDYMFWGRLAFPMTDWRADHEIVGIFYNFNHGVVFPHRIDGDKGGSIQNRSPTLPAHIVGFTLMLGDLYANGRIDVIITIGDDDKDKTVRKYSAFVPGNPWGRSITNILNIKAKMTPENVITLSNGKPIRIAVTRMAEGGIPEPIGYSMYDFTFCASL